MNFEAKWERIKDEDDPRRCQGVNKHGQCHLVAVEHSQYCPAHGGNRAFQAAKNLELRNYRLSKFHARVQELGNSDNIISLRDEVGLLRMLIEEKVNRCNNDNDLIMMSGPLSDLIMKVEKLVGSCHRLESKLGGLLDKTKVLQFAQTIVQIVASHVSDEETLETISDEILEALEGI